MQYLFPFWTFLITFLPDLGICPRHKAGFVSITFKFLLKYQAGSLASVANLSEPTKCQEIRMMASMGLRGSDGPKRIYGHTQRLKWTPT